MSIADRIQTLRKSKGISQEELADKIGVSRQAVSKWESGQSAPDIEKIILLSEFFGVTTDFLLKGIKPVARCENLCFGRNSNQFYWSGCCDYDLGGGTDFGICCGRTHYHGGGVPEFWSRTVHRYE